MNGYISGSFRLQIAFPSIHCATKETLPSDDLISHSCQYESVFFSPRLSVSSYQNSKSSSRNHNMKFHRNHAVLPVGSPLSLGIYISIDFRWLIQK